MEIHWRERDAQARTRTRVRMRTKTTHCSPGRLRILPNSLSSGSISKVLGAGAPGIFNPRRGLVWVSGADAFGAGGGSAGERIASVVSLSGGSADWPGMNQFLRLSSQLR